MWDIYTDILIIEMKGQAWYVIKAEKRRSGNFVVQSWGGRVGGEVETRMPDIDTENNDISWVNQNFHILKSLA